MTLETNGMQWNGIIKPSFHVLWFSMNIGLSPLIKIRKNRKLMKGDNSLVF